MQAQLGAGGTVQSPLGLVWGHDGDLLFKQMEIVHVVAVILSSYSHGLLRNPCSFMYPFLDTAQNELAGYALRPKMV